MVIKHQSVSCPLIIRTQDLNIHVLNLGVENSEWYGWSDVSRYTASRKRLKIFTESYKYHSDSLQPKSDGLQFKSDGPNGMSSGPEFGVRTQPVSCFGVHALVAQQT